jgi:hypothetical protein
VIIAIAIELITLHMIDGRVVQVNPAQITQLVHATGKGNKSFVAGVHCLVRMTDGAFVSVAETCEDVEKLVKGEKP